MKLGIALFLIGLALILYFSKVRLKKSMLLNIGILIGALMLIYGLILSIQPTEYIVYTKTTISK